MSVIWREGFWVLWPALEERGKWEEGKSRKRLEREFVSVASQLPVVQNTQQASYGARLWKLFSGFQEHRC